MTTSLSGAALAVELNGLLNTPGIPDNQEKVDAFARCGIDASGLISKNTTIWATTLSRVIQEANEILRGTPVKCPIHHVRYAKNGCRKCRAVHQITISLDGK